MDTIEKLADSLLAGKLENAQAWNLARAVDLIATGFPGADATALDDGVRRAMAVLNSQRQYGSACRLAVAWKGSLGWDATIAKHHAQALINQAALDQAEIVLQEAQTLAGRADASPQARRELLELDGLVARLEKDRFVATESSGRLLNAAERYVRSYLGSPKRPFWHGINAVALLHRCELMDIPTPGLDYTELAATINTQCLVEIETDPGNFWVHATLSEVNLALGDCDRAELWLYRFLNHPRVTPFALDSYERQLREIWLASVSDGGPVCPSRLVRILSRHMARFQARATIPMRGIDSVSSSTDEQLRGLEKNFSGVRGFSIETLRRMVAACASIGCVSRRTGAREGTGFLVRGADINPVWGDDPVFITNAHVISETVAGAVAPSDALVSFEVESGENGTPKFYAVEEGSPLFTSPPGPLGVRSENQDDLDVTVVRLKGLDPSAQVLRAADTLPIVTSKSKTYVVGHPSGGGLQVSLHDSLLLDIDEFERLVHYRTPTEPGSSGSPVFNTNWEVIAVHHGGSFDMPMLRDKGSYEANEGIALQAIRRRYPRNP